MENSISIDLEQQKTNHLPSWWLVLLLFLLISSLINFVYVKDIFYVSEGRPEEFVFKNFLIYNLGVKWILYPFKFAALAGLMMMGAFLFKVDKFGNSSILKVVVLAELVKYLPETLRIIWFTFVDFDNLEGYDMRVFNDNLSLNGVLGMTKENTIYPLFKYISITQLLYVLVVANLLKMSTKNSMSYHLYWFGITYGTAIILIGLGSTIISL